MARTLMQDGGRSPEDRIAGLPLLEGIAPDRLEAIARACEEHSLEGVDDFMKGVKLRQSASTWMPVMFDFKHIPSDQPKKGKQSLLQRIGLSKKPVGPGGFMSEWEALALQLEKDAL